MSRRRKDRNGRHQLDEPERTGAEYPNRSDGSRRDNDRSHDEDGEWSSDQLIAASARSRDFIEWT